MTIDATYRKAQVSDEKVLKFHFFRALSEKESQNHVMLPTQTAVDIMWDELFRPAIEDDRGVYVAEDGGRVIGALFWLEEPENRIPLRYKTAYGYGQDVEPWARKHGVFRGMMTFAKKNLEQKNVARVVDYVNGDSGSLGQAMDAGFKIHDHVVALTL